MLTLRRLVQVALVIIASCQFAVPFAQAVTLPTGVSFTDSEEDATEAYWTAARIAGATAEPAPASGPATSATPSTVSGTIKPVAQGNPPHPLSSVYTPQTCTWCLWVPESTRTPDITTGMVVFTRPDGSNGFCSGSTISSEGRSTVVTAARCVVDRATGGWRTKIAFVPAFYRGAMPFGTWAADHVEAHWEWVANSDPRYDAAIFSVRANAAGARLADVTGANGFAWGQPISQTVLALGYNLPYADRLSYCYGPQSSGPFFDVQLRCSMGAGAIGGGWLAAYKPAPGAGIVESVLSSVYGDYVRGPQFTDWIKSLYDLVRYDGGLNRYVNATGDHWVTTKPASTGYRYEGTLGRLLTTQQAGTVPIYACSEGQDHFLSNDHGCENATYLGVEGYAYSPNALRPGASAPLYRCSVNGERFVSTDSHCEGTTVEALLGYSRADNILRRYRAGSEHWETTGSQPVGYALEGPLGVVFRRSGGGTTSLYGCADGVDHFLSTSSTCEGKSVLRIEGDIFSPDIAQPAGSVAVYSCKAGTDRFASASSNCEGKTNLGLLGYFGAVY
jgi:hypothetical protein